MEPSELARIHEEQVLALRARVSQLDAEIRRYRENAGAWHEAAEIIVEAVRAVEPYPRVKQTPLDKALLSPYSMSAVADVSDLHVGEFIRPEETEGFGSFNWLIAQQRMFQYTEKLIGWTAMHRRSFLVPKLHIFAKGDYVSGDIHDELRRTNEFPTPVQAVNAGHLLGEFIARLSAHYDEIEVDCVGADNHGRLVPKPQKKQKAANSFSFIVHAIAQKYVANSKNVKFVIAEGMKMVVPVNGHSFLIEHGDEVKAYMGIPYYGMGRMLGREARRRMREEGLRFNYWSIGHWHVPAIVEGEILVNGSLSGTSEYDHSQGRHADPAQVSYMVHPKYGVFDWTAWKFKRSEDKDGRETQGKTGSGA